MGDAPPAEDDRTATPEQRGGAEDAGAGPEEDEEPIPDARYEPL